MHGHLPTHVHLSGSFSVPVVSFGDVVGQPLTSLATRFSRQLRQSAITAILF